MTTVNVHVDTIHVSHPSHGHRHDAPGASIPENLHSIHQRLHNEKHVYVSYSVGGITFTLAGSPSQIESWASNLVVFARSLVETSKEAAPPAQEEPITPAPVTKPVDPDAPPPVPAEEVPVGG